MIYPYLLLTEGRTVSYGPRFSISIYVLNWRKQGAVSYSTDREKEVSRMFVIPQGN